MITAIISGILFILHGISSAVYDTVSLKFDESNLSGKVNELFWNPAYSWRNKYKDKDPSKGKRYFGSTTFLVVFTDAVHLFKAISYITLFVGTLLSNNLILAIALYLFSKVIFEMTMRLLTKY